MTVSVATTPSKSRTGIGGIEGELCIPSKLQHYWSLIIPIKIVKIITLILLVY